MSLTAGLAIYGVVWWIVLFAILPIGVVSQHETGDYVQGTDPGAPVMPSLLRKALITTAVSAIVWLFIYWIWVYSPFGFDDIPFLPELQE